MFDALRTFLEFPQRQILKWQPLPELRGESRCGYLRFKDRQPSALRSGRHLARIFGHLMLTEVKTQSGGTGRPSSTVANNRRSQQFRLFSPSPPVSLIPALSTSSSSLISLTPPYTPTATPLSIPLYLLTPPTSPHPILSSPPLLAPELSDVISCFHAHGL